MNEPETDQFASDDLAAQVASLQRQLFVLLLALIVVSGTLTFYLFCQSRFAGKDLAAIRPQATQVIREFNLSRPALDRLIQQLVEYGRTHPEFQPILKKYGIVVSATNSAPVRN